jgi:predicted TIM-barrel fold metal-dependent hydrolase
MKIFDIHTHIYPDAIARRAVASLGEFYNFVPQGAGTYADMTEHARVGSVGGFLLFCVATNAHQVPKVNDAIAAAVRRGREDGFVSVGFAGMYQDYPDFEGEIDRCEKLGLRGVKIHPDIQHIDIDDPKFFPLYEILEGRMPVYFHMCDDRPQYPFSQAKKLAHVLELFPRLEVVAAHLGGYRRQDEAIEHLAGNPRVWYDTSSALWYLAPEEASRIIGRLGAETVMFGTDYPVMYPVDSMVLFDRLTLTDKQKEDILWNNAMRFLHLNETP